MNTPWIPIRKPLIAIFLMLLASTARADVFPEHLLDYFQSSQLGVAFILEEPTLVTQIPGIPSELEFEHDISQELSRAAAIEYSAQSLKATSVHQLLSKRQFDTQFSSAVNATRLPNGVSVPLKLSDQLLDRFRKYDIDFIIVLRGERLYRQQPNSTASTADIRIPTLFFVYDVTAEQQVFYNYVSIEGQVDLKSKSDSGSELQFAQWNSNRRDMLSGLIRQTTPQWLAQTNAMLADATP